mmetsp:Transcript_8555/g.20146  ORF Transcript_8555/g.20146 Transcript_8555/m.20146 type:complete len:270 (-) Transcript_8555:145-954(-)
MSSSGWPDEPTKATPSMSHACGFVQRLSVSSRVACGSMHGWKACCGRRKLHGSSAPGIRSTGTLAATLVRKESRRLTRCASACCSACASRFITSGAARLLASEPPSALAPPAVELPAITRRTVLACAACSALPPSMPVRYSRIISSGSMSCDSWPRCSPETSATKWSPPSPVCCGSFCCGGRPGRQTSSSSSSPASLTVPRTATTTPVTSAQSCTSGPVRAIRPDSSSIIRRSPSPQYLFDAPSSASALSSNRSRSMSARTLGFRFMSL